MKLIAIVLVPDRRADFLSVQDDRVTPFVLKQQKEHSNDVPFKCIYGHRVGLGRCNSSTFIASSTSYGQCVWHLRQRLKVQSANTI